MKLRLKKIGGLVAGFVCLCGANALLQWFVPGFPLLLRYALMILGWWKLFELYDRIK